MIGGIQTNSYIDYDYYTNNFGGDLIPQENFNKFANGASYEIRLRIQNRDISNFEIKVKNATCSVADILYNQFTKKEKIKNIVSGAEKVITSEKVGDYSRNISAVTLNYLLSLSSDEEVAKEINKIVEQYLLFTGLLYGGIDCVR